MNESFAAEAVAHPNIALSKYWGKCDTRLNLPAVPSLSMTLDTFSTTTRVEFDPRLRSDRLLLDGRVAKPGEAKRAHELLSRVRESSGLDVCARVQSTNNFPTASGLASSASGFAALAAAASAAAGMRFSAKGVSRLARRSSASAARSVWGGFVELPVGKVGDDSLVGRPVADENHWDLRLVIVQTAIGRKAVGSTDAMERSRKTSPYYAPWVEAAPGYHRTIRRAIQKKDLEAVGDAMEQSTLAFHTCAMTAHPSIVYWRPGTLAVLEAVRVLREKNGRAVYATMDAGPHVKALCSSKDVQAVRRKLARVDGVVQTTVVRPGPALQVHRL